MLWKLFVFSMTGLSGLRFSPITEHWVTITFENKGKEGFMPLLLQQTAAVVGSPVLPLEREKQKKQGHSDIQSVSRTLQRLQEYEKLIMRELIDMETREKEAHAAMIMCSDGVNQYKPVVHPHMVRFNEEMMTEITDKQRLLDIAQDKSTTLIQKIIKRLESNDI